MFDIGSGELLVILVVALMLFGGRLPDVARNLGRAVSDFKKGITESTRPLREAGAEVEREVAETGDGPRRTPPLPGPTPRKEPL